jgi:hypothetical protein
LRRFIASRQGSTRQSKPHVQDLTRPSCYR